VISALKQIRPWNCAPRGSIAIFIPSAPAIDHWLSDSACQTESFRYIFVIPSPQAIFSRERLDDMPFLTYSYHHRHEDKPVVWLRGEITSPPFSTEARREIGALLRQLQQGVALAFPQSRPMPGIGVRCHELRITDKESIWRIVYRIESDAIVILDIFAKKTPATPNSVIAQCKARLAQYKQAIK
jgi:phage-related protein